MKAKKVYVLKGFEDGLLGVYTNKKLLHKGIEEYMNLGETQDNTISYSKLCKELKDNFGFRNGIVEVDIRYLNSH